MFKKDYLRSIMYNTVSLQKRIEISITFVINYGAL